MTENIKPDTDYAAMSQTLVSLLNLEREPVAVRFAKSAEEIPEGMPEIDKGVRHCEMVAAAGKDGKVFYATAEKHICAGGAWALGLKQITPTLNSGEFYYKLGKYSSWASCMRTIKSIPHIAKTGSDEPATYATMYAPLSKASFVPNVVVITAKPITMLKLAQAVIYKTGGRTESEFSGIQSVCADACAQPYLTGKPNISLGCDGSRKFSGIADELMVMGIPAESLEDIVKALPVVANAAGSKK